MATSAFGSRSSSSGAPGFNPLTVSFTDNTLNAVSSYAWDFGDGTTSSLASPTHVYADMGTYTVQLDVSGPGGADTMTRTDYISVQEAPPGPAFTADVTDGFYPLTVAFTDASTGLVTTRVWDFGDGNTSSALDPVHTFQTPGTYTVSLALDGPGGSETLIETDYVTVRYAPPTANFSAATTDGIAPLAVQFNDASSGDITAYHWTFGDGGTSTLSAPLYIYNVPGTYNASLTVTGPGGADTMNLPSSITVRHAPPTAGFAAAPTQGFAPLEVTFSDASSGTITSYDWNFGDGNTSSIASPVHTFTQPGTYTVQLDVVGPGGNSAAPAQLITVAEPPPVADFSPSRTTGTYPLSITFLNESTGNISGYEWNFGDGTTSTETHPTHVYNTAGTFTVSLTTSGPGGTVTDTRVDLIVATEPPPVANFTADQTLGQAPFVVQFNDASTGLISSYSWSFGDGQQASSSDPEHTYEDPGIYTVSLTVAGPGGSATRQETNLIVISGYAPPVVSFDTTPTSGVAPLSVSFTDTSFGVVTSHLWSFGDGQVSTDASPTHVYTQAGTYSVTLAVTGPGGTASASMTDVVTVAEAPPVAAYQAVPTDGVAPLTVNFDDISSGAITARLWSFGDGATSTLASPAHVYSQPGTYTVSLSVSGPGGTDSRTDANLITVLYPEPIAGFAASPTSGFKPLTVQFTDTTVGEVTGYTWSFGDGSTSALASPSHTYSQEGTYTVSLWVDGPGGFDSLTIPDLVVVVTPPPVADFNAAPVSGVNPLTVTFTDASTGEISGHSWSFGDGGSSSDPSPQYTYATPGTYTVALTVSGPGGLDTRTRTDLVTVNFPPPVAAFTAAPRSGMKPLAVTFADLSTGETSARLWDFGDGNTSSLENPTHTYDTPGFYTVSLTSFGPGGSDTLTMTDYVTVGMPPPIAGFTATPTTGVAPLTVAFTNTTLGDVTAYSWNFGDGTTSALANPTHTYTTPGLYTVSLTAMGEGGNDTFSVTNLVDVAIPPPTAGFAANVTAGASPLAVAFTNNSIGAVSSFSWDFGDGASSSQANPNYVYNVPGLYTVSLTATGPGGSDTAILVDYIAVSFPPPVANFAATPTSGVAPLSVSFADGSAGSISSYSWDFGDGSSSNSVNPNHTYATPGIYTVTLTVTGPGGSDSSTRSGLIDVAHPAPMANFTVDTTTGIAPVLASFSDTSMGAITSYSWDFGDGSTSSLVNPTHTFAAYGTFTVSLTVTGPGGSDTLVRTGLMDVQPPAPAAWFTVSETLGNSPLTITFSDASSGPVSGYSWDFGDGSTSTLANPVHTFTTPGTYSVTLTVTGPGGQDTAVRGDLISALTPAASVYYISFNDSASLPNGPTVQDEDVATYNPATGEWDIYFDGSDVGVSSNDLDALHVRPDGSLLMSFSGSMELQLDGSGDDDDGVYIDDSDILLFTFTSEPGAVTRGFFTIFFDGSDVGMTSSGEDINGLHEFEDGTLAVTTTGTAYVVGASNIKDEDVMLFTGTTGTSTSGSFEWIFDGSDVGLSSSSEELDALFYEWDDNLLFSTRGSFATPDDSGADEDIARFTGTTVNGSSIGTVSRTLDLSDFGLSEEDVDAISML